MPEAHLCSSTTVLGFHKNVMVLALMYAACKPQALLYFVQHSDKFDRLLVQEQAGKRFFVGFRSCHSCHSSALLLQQADAESFCLRLSRC